MKNATSGEKQHLTHAGSKDTVQGREISPTSSIFTAGIQWDDE
jgi:hypothetical protein